MLRNFSRERLPVLAAAGVAAVALVAAAPAPHVGKPLHVIAQIDAKAGHAPELLSALSKLATAARGEKGCLSYQLFEDRDHSEKFYTYETWTNDAVLQAHLTSPTMKAASSTLKDIVDGRPVITKLDPVG